MRFRIDQPTLIQITWRRITLASPEGTAPDQSSSRAGTPNSSRAENGPARLTTIRWREVSSPEPLVRPPKPCSRMLGFTP